MWPSRRALRGRAGAGWMYRWSCLGTFSVANGGSKPSKMSDRSASLRRCSTTASGRESFPRSAGSPGSAETHTTLGHIQSRSPGPPARHPAFSQAVDEVTGSKTRSDQQETNGRRSAHAVSETALDQPAQRRPWMGTAPLGLHVPTATRPGSLSFKCTGQSALRSSAIRRLHARSDQ